MTKEQVAKTMAIDKEARAEHAASLQKLSDSNTPPLLRRRDGDASGILSYWL
jgi:hypothetical protein